MLQLDARDVQSVAVPPVNLDVVRRVPTLTPDPPSILKFFEYSHLPPHLQSVSAPFSATALQVVDTLQAGPERSVSLRKLLEAKDAAVRAAVHPGL